MVDPLDHHLYEDTERDLSSPRLLLLLDWHEVKPARGSQRVDWSRHHGGHCAALSCSVLCLEIEKINLCQTDYRYCRLSQ